MAAARIKEPDESDRFLDLVAFKWLMAGMGWWVDLSRLQGDEAYLHECLQRALTSDSELLRKRSVEMLGLRRRSNADGDAAAPSKPIGFAL